MKNNWALNLFIVAFFLVLTSMQLNPAPQTINTDFKVEIIQCDDLRLVIHCEKEVGSKLHLSLMKPEKSVFGYQSELIIYQDKIAADITDYNRILNLSNLENGTYMIEITGGKKRFTRQIEIQTVTETTPRPRVIVSVD
jgi:hypothetical protein